MRYSSLLRRAILAVLLVSFGTVFGQNVTVTNGGSPQSFTQLITGDPESGAFDYANTLTGNVTITLPASGSYTLSSGFTFDNTAITSLTLTSAGTGATRPTLTNDQNAASMITTSYNGSLTVENTIFHGNGASSTGNGGAINYTAGTSITFTNVQFGALTAAAAGTPVNALQSSDIDLTKEFIVSGNGGAIWAHSGVTSATFNGCSFYGGQATNGSAVNIESQAPTNAVRELSITNTAFIGCYATNGYAAFNENYVANANTKSLIVENCVFTDCIGTKDAGGAIVTRAVNTNVTNSSFTRCKCTTAAGNAGAIYINNGRNIAGTASVTDCAFTDCQITTTSGNGGALYVGSSNTNLVIENSSFMNCSAPSHGGAVYSAGTVSLTNPAVTDEILFQGCHTTTAGNEGGGAVYFAKGMTITGANGAGNQGNITFDGCTSKSDGGAIASNSTGSAGFKALNNEGTIRFENCSTNISGASSGSEGGALFIYYGGIEITNTGNGTCSFIGCSTNSTGGALTTWNNASGSITVIGTATHPVRFESCISSGAGGAIYTYHSSTTLRVENCEFEECQSNTDGGAMHSAGAMTLRNSTFTDCQAALNNSNDLRGGAVYVGGAATIETCNFTRCIAGKTAVNTSYYSRGGGLYANSTLTLTGCTFTGCKVTNRKDDNASGGGLFANGTSTISNCTFTGCESRNGGAMSVAGGNMSDDVTFTGCTATEKGGVLYVRGNFTMNGGTITGISAKYGAAVYVASGNFTLNGGEITGNNATEATGGAMQASTSGSMHFKGSAKVRNNTYDGTSGHNVYLDQDRPTVIYADGLAANAEINVFVVDAIKGKRGYSGRTFGTYTSNDNLNRIINERFYRPDGTTPLYGESFISFEGDQLIAWKGENIVLTLTAVGGTTPVANARFELRRDNWDANHVIWRGVSNADGQVTIPWTGQETPLEGSGNGGAASFINGRQYVLRQIESGTGYARPGGQWTITIDAANGLTAATPTQIPQTNYTYPLVINGTNLERNAWSTKNDSNTMDVVYNLNDGDAGATFIETSPQTVHFTTTSVVATETVYTTEPTWAGRRFLGWNTITNGVNGTSYTPGGPLYHTSAEVEGTLTLYAQWTPESSSDLIARVSNDNGANWSYHEYLIHDGTGTEQGAFNKANTLSGTVIIELLYLEHERYTLDQSFSFTIQSHFEIRTVSSLGGKATIKKDQATDPMIIFGAKQRNLTLKELIFDGQNNATPDTGGILRYSNSASALNITNCDFINCVTTGDNGQGGAIWWNAAVTLNLDKGDMRFENCQASKAGGAIYANGTVTINNTSNDTITFGHCTSETSGGAIYTTSTVTMNNTNFGTVRFDNCKANGGTGGAITGGAFIANNNTGTIAFNDCEATSHGGAVYSSSTSSSTMDNNNGIISFTNCLTTASGNGGAICKSTYGHLTAKDNQGTITFMNCSAMGNGGALSINSNSGNSHNITMTNSGNGQLSFTNCSATANGGAIYRLSSSGGNITITGTTTHPVTFEKCQATGGSGGGLFNEGSTILTSVSFGVSGDATKACTASAAGGAVYSGDLTYTNNSSSELGFYYSTAGTNGGAINSTGTVTLQNTGGGTVKFETCEANNGTGGAISTTGIFKADNNNGTIAFNNCEATSHGGAVYSGSSSSSTMDNNTGIISFINCQTTASGNGGAICKSSYGHLTATDNQGTITFMNCSAMGQGGALSINSSSSNSHNITMTNSGNGQLSFTNCSATANGGAIYRLSSSGGNITITGTTTHPVLFEKCQATDGSGGGLYNQGPTTLTNVIFGVSGDETKACTASAAGGAVYSGGDATINTTQFHYCSAATNGGGVYSGGAATINTAQLYYCSAATNGGGVYSGGAATLTSVQFYNSSSSSGNGGGLYAASTGTLSSVEFHNCSATNGGGVFFNSGANSMTNCTATGCTATTYGAAVHLQANRNLTINGGSYTGNRSDNESGGAINATNSGTSGGTTGLYFSGDVVVYDNPSTGANQKNVVLTLNNNTTIRTTAAGLGANAKVGIYCVTGDVYTNHGYGDQAFGTYAGENNLEKFINDRNTRLTGASGASNLIVWAGDGICKLTDGNNVLLYKNDQGTPAVYGKIQNATTAAGGLLYAKNADVYEEYTGTDIKLKMLQDYEMISSDVPSYTGSRALTITTAELEAANTDGYFYERESGTDPYEGLREADWASIKRVRTASPLITLNTTANITVEKLLFDGDDVAFTSNGGCFSVSNIGGLSINDVLFENFKCANGGAIYSAVNLTFDVSAGKRLSILNCTATEGAAIRVVDKVLTINNAGTITISGCTAANAGGAISTNTNGALTVNNSGSISFTDCTYTGIDYGGGAIWTGIFTAEDNSGSLSFNGCTSANKGGAIVANRNAASTNTFKLTNTGSGSTSFEDCTAIYGGAVYVTNGIATLTGVNAENPIQFENCKAQVTGNNGTEAQGGAVYVAGGSLGLKNVSFTGCEANKTCGGSYNANAKGGAVYANVNITLDGTVKFTNCKTYAKTTSTSTSYKPYAYGGAIFFGGARTLTNNATGTTKFISCQAEVASGFDVNAVNANRFARGGAIYCDNASTITNNGTLNFESCTIPYALANGSESTANGGGGIFAANTLTLTNAADKMTTFKDCSARTAAAIYAAAALSISGGTTKFENCEAIYAGGAIRRQDGDGVLSIANAEFEDCTAGSGGGAFYTNTTGAVTVNNCSFTNCESTCTISQGGGGAIWKAGTGAMTMTDCAIEGCHSQVNQVVNYYGGGAIYLANGNLTLVGTGVDGSGNPKMRITGCTATTGDNSGVTTIGGAINMASGKIVSFEGDVKVWDNTNTDHDTGHQHNVILDQNNNGIIKTTATGISSNSQIGVYVVDDQMAGHGNNGMPFGTMGAANASNLEKFVNDRNDRLFGTSHGSSTTIYWGSVICKIVDNANAEHPFSSLMGAVNWARSNSATAFINNVATVEMLTDYTVISSDVVNLDNTIDNFVFTTASTTAGTYTSEVETATLTRGWNGGDTNAQALFYVNNASAMLTTTNLILDGKEGTTQRTGRAMYVNSGTASVQGGTTIRNFNTGASGSAVSVAASGSFNMDNNTGDILFENCWNTSTNAYGGTIYTASSMSMDNNSGSITFRDCYSTGQNADGGAIATQAGAATNYQLNALNNKGTILFENCRTQGTGTQGGAIFVLNGLVDMRCAENGQIKFVNCYVQGADASYGGGAICGWNNTEIKLIGTTTYPILFENCRTEASGGGGAVKGAKVTLENVTFGALDANGTVNTAKKCYTIGGNGGAVAATGELSVTNCNFYGSTSSAYGGAIFQSSAGAVTVTGTNFTDCSGTCGGGVFIESENTARDITFERCNFTRCNSSTYAAICEGYTNPDNARALNTYIRECTFTDCKSTDWAGALVLRSNNTHIEDCDFVGCCGTTTGTEGNNACTAYINCTTTSTGKTINVTRCNFDNAYIDGEGISHNMGMVNGGTLNVQRKAQDLNILGSVFKNSKSNGNGGAVYANATNTTIGKSTVPAGHTYTTGTAVGLSEGDEINSSFTDCYATTSGGAVYLVDAATLTDVIIDGHNTLAAGTANATNGGGIYAATTFTISGGKIKNCTATNGGGIYAYANNNGSTVMTIGIDSISGCSATNGGGIYFYTGKPSINSTIITDNSASGNGGGIYFNTGTPSINSTIITDNSASGNGGGIYFNAGTPSISESSITENSASGMGGGVYSNTGLTLKSGTSIEWNTLTTDNVENGAGIYMANSKTLTIGTTGDGDGGNDVTVLNNSVDNGDASNVRLAADGTNNWASSVSILSKMTGAVGVCNPGVKDTPLGTQGATNYVDPEQDSRIFSDLDSRVAVTKDGDVLKVVWAGDYVCKLTDADGHLLRYKQGDNYLDAKFFSVKTAFDHLNNIEADHFHNASNEEVNPAYLKMLCDYHMRKAVTLTAGIRDFTFTTAGTVAAEEDDLPYVGPTSADTTATLCKGGLTASMFTMSAADAITVGNIILDGKETVGQITQPAWKANGMFLVNNASAQLTVSGQATVQNIRVKSGNSTLQVQNGGTINIEPGALFDSCYAKVNGGVARVTGAGSTLEMTGGTVQNCNTTQNGGALYVDADGTLTVNASEAGGATFMNCSANSNGGAIYTGGDVSVTNATFGVIDEPDLGCSAREDGGAIYSVGSITYTNNTADTTGFYYCKAIGGSRCEGGAMYASTRLVSTITLNNTNGGTILFDHCESTHDGGTISVQENTMNITNTGTISIDHSTSNENGGGICTDGYALYINNAAGATLSICNCTSATEGGAIEGTPTTGGNNSGTIIIDHCTSNSTGGGIHGSTIDLTGSGSVTISHCEAGSNHSGGGIYASGLLTLANCVVDSCAAVIKGGGIYANSTAVLDGCSIHANTLSGTDASTVMGAGIYANNNLTLKNGTAVTENKFTEVTNVANGAGIYMTQNHTLILGADYINTETSTVYSNEAKPIDENTPYDSNVRLAVSEPNNWYKAVNVQSNLGDYIGVCNPGAAGTQFGTDLLDGTIYRTGLEFLVSDVSDMHGGVLPPNSNANVYWLPDVSRIICKITDENGNLLTYNNGMDAVFTKMKDAITAMQNMSEGYFKDKTNTNPVEPKYIKMVVDSAMILNTTTLEVKYRSFTLTTALTTDADYPYDNEHYGSSWPATLYKGKIKGGQDGMFKIINPTNDVTITFEDIKLDGRSNALAEVPTASSSPLSGTGIATVAKGGTTKAANIVLNSGATLQNCRTSSYNGKCGALYIYNGGTVEIKDGALFTNCINNSEGGAVRITGAASSLTMTGGTVRDCASKYNGGGFYINAATNSISGALFDGCANLKEGSGSNYGGGAIYSTGANLDISNTNFTSCTSKDSGGAIYQYSTNKTTTLTNVNFGEKGNESKGCSAEQDGGGVYSRGNVIYRNTTNGTIGAYYAKCGTKAGSVQTEGGAIYVNYANNSSSSTLSVENLDPSGTINFEHCEAIYGDGGALGVQSWDGTIVNHGTINFVDCISGQDGGAICVDGYVLHIDNKAGATLSFDGCVSHRSHNTSNYDTSTGGAISGAPDTGDDGNLGTIIISNCAADDKGGAIYSGQASKIECKGAGTFTIEGCTVLNPDNNSGCGNGGAIYNNADLKLDGVTIRNNKASNQGGGIYANNTLTLKGTTLVEWNALTNGDEANGAGVYMNQKTLTIGDTSEGDAGNNVTIQNDTVTGGALSNLRLASYTSGSNNGNNWTNAVLVNSKMNGTVGVCNPGRKDTQLGTQPSTELNDPSGIPHIISDVNVLVAQTKSGEVGKIIWRGDPICKITDSDGHLLKYRDGDEGDYTTAVFFNIVDAFKQLNKPTVEFVNLSNEGRTPSFVKMLNDYTMRSLVTFTKPAAATYGDITFTTASTEAANEDDYPFTGAGTTAHIFRGTLTGTLFTLNANEELTLSNVTLDGRANADQLLSEVTAVSRNSMFHLSNNSPQLTLDNGATVQYSRVTSSYSAIRLSTNGSTLNINAGAVIDSCAGINSNSVGGAVRLDYGTLTMTGGTVSNCSSVGNGGAFYLQRGTTTISGGTISGNTASNGGGIYVDSNASLTMSGGTIGGNLASNQGGGIYANANITLKGDATIEWNGLTNSNVANGAGIYMVGSGSSSGSSWRTLTIGDVLEEGNTVTIANDTVAGGELSNLRLASYTSGTKKGNNWEYSVRVNSLMAGEVGVCNPGKATTQFGTQPSVYETDPSGTSHIVSDINSLKAGTYSPQQIVWLGTPICKFTDIAGNLLYYSQEDVTGYAEAVFYSLEEAFEELRLNSGTNFHTGIDPSAPSATPTHLKMLLNYSMKTATNVQGLPLDITLTTAGTGDALHPFVPDDDETIATLYKGNTNTPLFNIKNTDDHTLTLDNLVFDGRKDATSSVTNVSKGMFYVNANDVTLTHPQLSFNNVTVQNINNRSSYSTIHLEKKAQVEILDDALFKDLTGAVNGGVARVLGSSTLTMKGGTIQNCSSSASGGVFYSTSSGHIQVESGTFSNCQSTNGEGGAIYANGGTVSFDTPSGKTLLFNNCSAGYDGGAISVQVAPMSIANAGTISFTNCTSGQDGGGICTDAYPLTVSNTGTINFNNCSSTSTGGAMQAAPVTNGSNSGDITITNCTSNSTGGGIYAGSNPVNLTGTGSVTISGCNSGSSSSGGGIYVSGTLTVSGEVKVDNNRKGSGGALNNAYMAGSNKTITIAEQGLSCGSRIGVSNNSANNRVVAQETTAGHSLTAGANHFFFDDSGQYQAYCLNHSDPDYSTDKVYFIASWRNQGATATSIDYTADDDGYVTVVKTAKGLAYFAKEVNDGKDYSGKTVTLNANLDLNASLWEPVGLVYPCACDNDRPFKGTFDGQGHTISNLRSFLPHAAMGLFGLIGEGGTVKNIFIESGNLECTYADGSKDVAYIGGLAGELDKGTIAYSEAHVTMSGTPSVMGGLVGKVTGTSEKPSTIHSSMAMSEMSGSHTMGGLVGTIGENSTLANSFANAKFTVSGTPVVGGLVGINDGTVDNCYSRMQEGSTTTGSSFGWLAGNNGGTIRNCYAPATPLIVIGSTIDCDTYTPTALASGKYKYGMPDQKVGTAPNVIPLVNKLNDQATGTGYAKWTRTMASPINGDYPVLMMPGTICLGSKDGIFITYNTDLNDQITAYNGVSGGGNIYLYDVPSEVTANTDSDVRVYIDENIGILQGTGNVLNARVGVTFDNSEHNAGLWGKPYDWHMFSSALKKAPLGLEYHTTQSGYPGVSDYYVGNHYSDFASSGIPDADYQVQWKMDPPKVTFWQTDNSSGDSYYNGSGDNMIGYFPTDAPYGPWRNEDPSPYTNNDGFDFYSYSEPNCHWVNFKREGKTGLFDHWRQDADPDDHRHHQIKYTNEKTLTPGRGYMMAIGQESMLMADGVLNNGDITNDSITFSSGLWGSQALLMGCNLIGNPYQSYLDFSAFVAGNSGLIEDNAYYVIDADAQGYITYPNDGSGNPVYASRYIHPHQGFFVRVTSETDLTFTNAMREAGTNVSLSSNFRDERLDYPLVNLLCYDGDGKRDLTTVEIARPETGGAHKMKGLRLGNALIYAHFENSDYQALFAPEGVSEVPVRFEVFEDGVFTMKWSMYNGDFHYVHLIDNLTGADIDLLNAEEYKFEGHSSDYISRFKLVFQVTGIDEPEPEPAEGYAHFAFLFGEELIVTGEGTFQLFDLNGRCLLSTRLAGEQSSVPLPSLSKGMYLLRLTGNQQTQVQKMVIK